MPRAPEIAGKIANRNEMAGLLGVSVTTLDRYVLSDCPVESRSDNRREYRFNTADVLRWHAERKRARVSGVEDGKRRYQAAAAELKELELAERRGLMISVEEIRPILEDELANVRSRLLAIPGRLGPKITGMTDQAAVEMAIKGEVIAALTELTQG